MSTANRRHGAGAGGGEGRFRPEFTQQRRPEQVDELGGEEEGAQRGARRERLPPGDRGDPGELPELRTVDRGLLHLFLQHTSASLSLNENADPSVRADVESHFGVLAPENAPHYTHDAEGPDDMPAHLKSAMLGCGVTIPVTGGRLNLGTWQGIYLGEHRDRGGARRVVATIMGE